MPSRDSGSIWSCAVSWFDHTLRTLRAAGGEPICLLPARHNPARLGGQKTHGYRTLARGRVGVAVALASALMLVACGNESDSVGPTTSNVSPGQVSEDLDQIDDPLNGPEDRIGAACSSLVEAIAGRTSFLSVELQSNSSDVRRVPGGVFFGCVVRIRNAEGVLIDVDIDLFTEPAARTRHEYSQTQLDCCLPTDGSITIEPIAGLPFDAALVRHGSGPTGLLHLEAGSQIAEVSIRPIVEEREAYETAAPDDWFEALTLEVGRVLGDWIVEVGGAAEIAKTTEG